MLRTIFQGMFENEGRQFLSCKKKPQLPELIAQRRIRKELKAGVNHAVISIFVGKVAVNGEEGKSPRNGIA
jgi:hypothetical protein